MFIKLLNWSIFENNSNDAINQSTYDKATITYPVEKVIYKTTTEKKQDTVVDADGNTIVLREYEVEVPITETTVVVEKVSKINPETNEEVFEEIKKEVEQPIIEKKYREMARHNPYDAQWVVIISDDAKVLTEEEYKAEIARINNRKETPLEAIRSDIVKHIKSLNLKNI